MIEVAFMEAGRAEKGTLLLVSRGVFVRLKKDDHTRYRQLLEHQRVSLSAAVWLLVAHTYQGTANRP